MKPNITPASLEKALANDGLVFFYQPIISLSTGKICGAESLIRWKQTDDSMIFPDLFIPLAEKTGFITEITKAMLPKVVNDLTALNLVDDSLFVTFNVSPKDFANTDFLKILSQSTSGKLGKLENLYIEITESSFLINDEPTQRILRDIDSQGVSFREDCRLRRYRISPVFEGENTFNLGRGRSSTRMKASATIAKGVLKRSVH